ncbi:MAG: hypothetical protein R3B89_24840 [Polyangiaceae bacterium]
MPRSRAAGTLSGRALSGQRFRAMMRGSSPPVILTDMNPTIAVDVLGGTIVGVMLYFERDPLAMLSSKYGEPEYWRTDGEARPAASLLPKVGVALWRLGDGDISLRRSAGFYAVMYEAKDVRRAIESANY